MHLYRRLIAASLAIAIAVPQLVDAGLTFEAGFAAATVSAEVRNQTNLLRVCTPLCLKLHQMLSPSLFDVAPKRYDVMCGCSYRSSNGAQVANLRPPFQWMQRH